MKKSACNWLLGHILQDDLDDLKENEQGLEGTEGVELRNK